MWIERLDASHALDYRALMLEAYDLHPQAFTCLLYTSDAADE